MAIAAYVADTSAWARIGRREVRTWLAPLVDNGLVATTSLVDLELLFSSRNAAEHQAIRRQRKTMERLSTEQVDWDRAEEVQALLAAQGLTRAVGIPDLVLAATAERHRVTLVHYDRDFDLIAAVTGQRVAWVAPAGSVP